MKRQPVYIWLRRHIPERDCLEMMALIHAFKLMATIILNISALLDRVLGPTQLVKYDCWNYHRWGLFGGGTCFNIGLSCQEGK